MKTFSMDQDLRIQIFYVDSKLSETVDSGQTVCSSKKVGDSLVPSASAPNIIERWEMLLSPGTVISPFNALVLVNII